MRDNTKLDNTASHKSSKRGRDNDSVFGDDEDAASKEIARHQKKSYWTKLATPNPRYMRKNAEEPLKKKRRVCISNKFCPPRIDQLANPTTARIEGILSYFCNTLEPERVVRLVKLIHMNEEPKSIRHTVKKKKKPSHKKNRKHAKEKIEKEWLNQQTDVSAQLIMGHLNTRIAYTPNYKQVVLSLSLMRALKAKNHNRMFKENLLKFCEQLAIISDREWEPYQKFDDIETESEEDLVPAEHKKHVFYRIDSTLSLSDKIDMEEGYATPASELEEDFILPDEVSEKHTGPSTIYEDTEEDEAIVHAGGLKKKQEDWIREKELEDLKEELEKERAQAEGEEFYETKQDEGEAEAEIKEEAEYGGDIKQEADIKQEDAEEIKQEAEDGAEIKQEPEDAVEIKQEPEDGAEIKQEAEDGVEIKQEPEDVAEIKQEAEDAVEIKQEPEDGAEIKHEAEEEIKQQAEDGVEIKQEPEDGAEIKQDTEDAEEIKQEGEDGAEIKQETKDADEIKQEAEDGAEIMQEAESGAEIKQVPEDGAEIMQEAEGEAEIKQEADDGAEIQQEAEDVADIKEKTEDGQEKIKEEGEGGGEVEEAEPIGEVKLGDVKSKGSSVKDEVAHQEMMDEELTAESMKEGAEGAEVEEGEEGEESEEAEEGEEQVKREKEPSEKGELKEEEVTGEKIEEKDKEAVTEKVVQIWTEHPEGTASYVSYRVYSSWLEEFGQNIQTYSTCLRTFREIVTRAQHEKDTSAAQHSPAIREVLLNWSNYLAETMRFESAMKDYFKGKTVTRCNKCSDSYNMYNLPSDEEHPLPPELREALAHSAQWKQLLANAEKHCQLFTSILESESFGSSYITVDIQDISSLQSVDSAYIVEEVEDD